MALAALLTISAYFLADTVSLLIGHGLQASPRFSMRSEQERPALLPRQLYQGLRNERNIAGVDLVCGSQRLTLNCEIC